MTRLGRSHLVRRAASGSALIVALAAPPAASAQGVPAAHVPVRQTTTTNAHGDGAAGDPGDGGLDPNQADQESIYDRIWKLTNWYQDDSNPVLQRVQFTGRFQQDYATVDADEGTLSEWNVRRMRLGSRVTMFRDFTLHGEVDLNPQEAEPLYVRLTDLYVQWNSSARLALTVGKQNVPFTLDGSTSSKELLTIDRNNLSNNIWFPDEYMPGVSASGRRAAWNYRAGMFSAGEENREFGEFNGGVFALGSVGYDFAKPLGVKEALLSGSYVYQHPDEDNTFTRQLGHIGSLYFKMEARRWGLRADVGGATGYLGQSDLWGFVILPFVNVTGKLQVAGRYTFVTSSDPNGVRLATYENRVVTSRGDRYDELYVGANYYFYGNRLKVQSGVQFADMDDRAHDGGAYSGVSWTTGLRVGWP
jgi:phosphate-selective porin OprO/OprP